jgi:hypothetical protein
MPLNVKYAIRTSQMDTLEEAMTKATEMEEIMIEMGVDPDIILGKVQRQMGGLNIDNQGASSSRRNMKSLNLEQLRIKWREEDFLREPYLT